MIWRLRDLLHHNVLRYVERDGAAAWVSDRPVPGPFRDRLRAAWLVLTGRADALTWPEDDDPSSWCNIVAPGPREYERAGE